MKNHDATNLRTEALGRQFNGGWSPGPPARGRRVRLLEIFCVFREERPLPESERKSVVLGLVLKLTFGSGPFVFDFFFSVGGTEPPISIFCCSRTCRVWLTDMKFR